MIAGITSSGGRRDTIRPLPFFFSGRFFLLFAVASIMLIPLYNVVPGGIVLPLAVDSLILVLALADFFLGPSAKAIEMARPIPYPLAVDKSSEICLEVTNRTGSTVSLIERHALRLRRQSREEQVRPFRKYGAGMEFDSLREYAVGDDFRLIHWGTTARRGKLKRRSLVVLFTDLIDERSSAGLLRYSLGLLPRHLPLVVALSDSELIALADSVPETAQDLYKQGVAAEVLRRRELLVAKLSSLGAIVADLPPESLSAAVLDQYLEIKARNLL